MTSLTRARTMLFIVLAIALAIPAILFVDERAARSISRLISSVYPVSGARVAQIRSPVVFAALSFGWSLIVGIAIVAWMRAAYEFARQRLRVRDVEYRSWVFWSWIIPVINLYKPCQVLREIHRCGHPSAGTMPLSDLRSSAALVLWWMVHRTMHFFFVLSLFIMVLSAVSRIPLSPFPSLLAQARWTALLYVLMTLGWFVVAGGLTARLRRHPAYAGESSAAEADADEEEEEQEADDWADEGEQEDETRHAFFSAAHRREPQFGELPDREEARTTTSASAASAQAMSSASAGGAAPAAMPAASGVSPHAPAHAVPPAVRNVPPRRHEAQMRDVAPSAHPVPHGPPAPLVAPIAPIAATTAVPASAPVIANPASVPINDPVIDDSGFDEAAAYERIADELETGKRDKGAWLRAVVESGADEARQPVLYAQLRLRQLRQAHYKELEDLAERRLQEEQERVANEQAAERRREAERYLLDAFHHQDALSLDGPAFLEVARAAADEHRVNQRSRSNGKTLLHMAVERVAFHTRMADEEDPNTEALAYDRQAIRVLLDAGADPGLRDRNARSAHDYARAVGVPLRQMV